jgi:hypothetical protein
MKTLLHAVRYGIGLLDSLSDSVESYSNTAVKRIEKFVAAVLGRNLSLMPFSVPV